MKVVLCQCYFDRYYFLVGARNVIQGTDFVYSQTKSPRPMPKQLPIILSVTEQ